MTLTGRAHGCARLQFYRWILSIFCFFTSVWTSAIDFPKPDGYVTDNVGLLSPADRQALEKRITAIEQRTSAEIAIVIVPTLQGEVLETYANELFRHWGVGKKDKNNGVLLLIVPPERKMRIEVGYGLESVLTDGQSGEIMRTRIAPSFREGRYVIGLQQALDAMEQVLMGVPMPEQRPKKKWYRDNLEIFLFFLFFVLPSLFGTALSVGLSVICVVLLSSPWKWLSLLLLPFGIGWDIWRWKHPDNGMWMLRDIGGWGGFGGGGGGFGGFGGGDSGGGGASGDW